MDIIYIWWPKETMLGVREVVKIEVKTLVKKKTKQKTSPSYFRSGFELPLSHNSQLKMCCRNLHCALTWLILIEK